MDFQFYPTPKPLVERAWNKFKNRDFVRVLEPSAGEGDLAKGWPHDEMDYLYRSRQPAPVDCIEIDVTKHPVLRQHFNVVGVDFMDFNGSGAIYSHIIMNPPFANGVQHVLKAWNILYDGEIVAILNAETIRNPFSKEREMLVRLIEKHGEVEFISGAFSGVEAERKTDVDVALVYLRKESTFDKDLLGDIMDGLMMDGDRDLGAGFQEANELAIPANFVENAVLMFDAAVKAMRESVFAEARASKYASRIGMTMEQLNSDSHDGETSDKSSLKWVRCETHKRYEELKNRAWASIIRSTDVLHRLSSSAQKRIESEFEEIKKLEFSVSNIYGFLGGLAAKQGDIQIQMACDVFDLITRYHTENTVYYMGWKSNDAHRTCGMRIKTTRFVIPGNKTEGWQRALSWNGLQMLRDFDKVFSMLDGKTSPDVPLEHVFRFKFDDLRQGSRETSSYFDVRYYPKRGTIHFFPRDNKLVDRLNRLVGRQRGWLPHEGANVSKDFWLQYEKAEKFDAEVRAEVYKNGHHGWDDPLWRLTSRNAEEQEIAAKKVVSAISSVLEANGIDPVAMLEAPESDVPALPGANLPSLKAA
jgi:hypothetical protein